MKATCLTLLVALLSNVSTWAQVTTALTVEGTHTIYGSGLDVPPADGISPPFIKFAAGVVHSVFFQSVTGTVTSGYTFGPDGEGPTTLGTAMDSYAGLSGLRADRAFFLCGVFLNDSPPDPAATPPTLDFRPTGLGRDFTSLSPAIAQTFYIGDGRVGDGGSGTLQAFDVPASATRLFLGIIDGQFDGAQVFGQVGNYYDNRGAFVVEIALEQDPCVAQLSIHVSQVDLCWGTCSNRLYQVQYRSFATTNAWVNLGPPIPGQGATNCLSDPIDPAQPRRFYQVLTLP